MKLVVSYCCDIGNGRANNEDGVLVCGEFFRDTHGLIELPVTNFPILFAVADGIGGEEYGELASQIVLETFAKQNPADPSSIEKTIALARKQLRDYAETNAIRSKMGTTIAALVIVSEDSGLVFNVGDSRVYEFKSGYARQLSRDHSLVQTLVEIGQLDPEEAKNHPQRHILTSYISVDEDEPNVYLRKLNLFPETPYLICSDGLWEFVSEDEMEKEMEQAVKESKVNHALNLTERAKKYGSNDNISAIVVTLFGE